MKSKLVLCMLILSNVLSLAKCQELLVENYWDNLDTSKISTGILVVPYNPIQEFNGTSDTIITNFDNWIELYKILYYSHLNNPVVTSLKDLRDSINKNTIISRMPIGIINMNYNTFKDNAFDDSLLVVNDSVLFDGPNNSSSPYLTNRCFAASILANQCSNTQITFFTNDKFTFSNSNIQNYIIDFDDGNSPVLLNNNDECTLSYSESGNKCISIKAILLNGDTLRCKSTLLIVEDQPVPPTEYLVYAANNSTSTFQTVYYVTDKPQNMQNDRLDSSKVSYEDINHIIYEGTFGTWYGCNSAEDKKIRKPVIFVEGFDPTDSNSLLDGTLFAIANQESLVVKLLNEGFDVIILDFNDGGAKIEGNAMVLKALIEKVNKMKVTNNELVILGASMGGLVARYALSYIESIQENHRTRLLITYDTPNQGSYGSLAGQHFFDIMHKNKIIKTFLKEEDNEAIDKKFDYINCDAAKQMLVYHYSAAKDNLAYEHEDRKKFMKQLTSLPNGGYPSCRKVAFSCGGGYGENSNQGFEAGAELLNVFALKFPIPVLFDIRLYALPYNIQQQVLKLNVYLLVNFIPIAIPSLRNVTVSYDKTEPYDNCPGGYYPLVAGLGNAIDDFFDSGQIGWVNYQEDGVECFVPTVSALDLNANYLKTLNQGNSYLMTNINQLITGGINYFENTNKNITPYDAIYYNDKNHRHIDKGGITEDAVIQLVSEISRDVLALDKKAYTTTAVQLEAKNSIFASSPNGYFVIAGCSNIVFQAGESIVLDKGFSVFPPAKFSAIVKKSDVTISYTNGGNIAASSPRLLNNNTKNNNTISKEKIQSSENKQFSLYPNPSLGIFNLNIDCKMTDCNIVTIYNKLGINVYSEKFYGPNKTIELNQPSGIYLLKVNCGNKTECIKLVIK